MKTHTNRYTKTEPLFWRFLPVILILAGLIAAEAATAQERRGLTPQQLQANEQVIANKLYETAFKAEPVKGNPFDDYEDVIVHNDGSFTLLAPANRTTRNPDGSRTFLSGANRLVRYSPDGEIEWERSLSGNKQTQLDEASKGGEIITLLEADGVRWKLSAIYDQNGNEITLDTDRIVNKEIKVSPSGNYLYATDYGNSVSQFELYSPTGTRIKIPFDQLLSIDRSSYKYNLGFRIFDEDLAIVSLYEKEEGAQDGDKDNLVRATLNVISLEKEIVLFTYDRKVQNPARTAIKTVSVPLNTIQFRGEYIYFVKVGSTGSFYGYHMPTQTEIIQFNRDDGGWPYISQDNQYLLRRTGSGILSIKKIFSGEEVQQFTYQKSATSIQDFKINDKGLLTLLAITGKQPNQVQMLALFELDGNIQYELYGWFVSPETGYIRDIQNTYRLTTTQREVR